MATEFGAVIVPQPIDTPAQDWANADGLIAGVTTRGEAACGYALWSYDGTNWSLTKDRSAPGFRPSAAPTIPGRFKGQVRALLSVPE